MFDKSNSFGDLVLAAKAILLSNRGENPAEVAMRYRHLQRAADILRKGSVSSDAMGGLIDIGRGGQAALAQINTSVIDTIAARLAPMLTPLLIGSTATTGIIVGGGQIPVLGNVRRDSLTPVKTGGISVFTKEQASSDTAEAEAFIGRILRNAIADCSNKAFIEALELDSNVASVASTGTAATNILVDINSAIQTFDLCSSSRIYVLCSHKKCASLALKSDNGQLCFPNLQAATGGEMAANITVIPVSAGVDIGDSNGELAIVFDADGMHINRGQIYLQRSESATVQMSDTPNGNELVSIFQADLVALKFIRTFAVEPFRPSIAVITGVEW